MSHASTNYLEFIPTVYPNANTATNLARPAELVMGKGVAELVTGERGSIVSDGEKG